MSALAALRLRIPAHVVHRPFASETVVVNLRTGRSHALDPTAGRMFELLGAGEARAEIVTRLADELARPVAVIEEELRRIADRLLERGLLELDAGTRR